MNEKPKKSRDQRRADHAWHLVDRVVARYVVSENGKQKVKPEGKKFGG